MQTEFIDELEQQGKGRIEDNNTKINTLLLNLITMLK